VSDVESTGSTPSEDAEPASPEAPATAPPDAAASAAAPEPPDAAASAAAPEPPATGSPADAAAAASPADAPAVPAANVTKLVNETASKSKVMWVRVPGGSAHPVWYVWHDDGDPRGTGPSAYVVSGPGEQSLPWLPEQVELVLRSKDTGGRLLVTSAHAQELAVGTPEWDAAVELLSAERLNATSDAATAWAQGCAIHVITPHGRPTESPGDFPDAVVSDRIESAPGTTVGWRPWHLGGRPQVRRRLRSR